MTAEDYDTWYRSSRGAWIGETEYRLLWAMLGVEPGQTLLDVGCGTGYFSRRFAVDGVAVTGIDPDATMVEFATAHRVGSERYLDGDGVPLVAVATAKAQGRREGGRIG